MQMKTQLYGGLVETALSPDGPVRSFQTLDARYVLWARWRIPDGRDLKQAFGYMVKWDKLYVKWSAEGDVETIDAFERPGETDQAYKYPDSYAFGRGIEAINPDDVVEFTAVNLALL